MSGRARRPRSGRSKRSTHRSRAGPARIAGGEGRGEPARPGAAGGARARVPRDRDRGGPAAARVGRSRQGERGGGRLRAAHRRHLCRGARSPAPRRRRPRSDGDDSARRDWRRRGRRRADHRVSGGRAVRRHEDARATSIVCLADAARARRGAWRSAGPRGRDARRRSSASSGSSSDREVRPIAQDVHRRDVLIPIELIAKLSEAGVFGLTIPEQYGGLGLGKVAMCIVTEELSRGYIGVGSLGTRSEIAAELILGGGTEAQKDEWLPEARAGRGDEHGRVHRAEPRFRPRAHQDARRAERRRCSSSTARRPGSRTPAAPI